jgi:hypothetical protein
VHIIHGEIKSSRPTKHLYHYSICMSTTSTLLQSGTDYGSPYLTNRSLSAPRAHTLGRSLYVWYMMGFLPLYSATSGLRLPRSRAPRSQYLPPLDVAPTAPSPSFRHRPRLRTTISRLTRRLAKACERGRSLRCTATRAERKALCAAAAGCVVAEATKGTSGRRAATGTTTARTLRCRALAATPTRLPTALVCARRETAKATRGAARLGS